MNLRIAYRIATAGSLLLLASGALADQTAQPTAKAAPGAASTLNTTERIATPSVEKLHAELIGIMRSAEEYGKGRAPGSFNVHLAAYVSTSPRRHGDTEN